MFNALSTVNAFVIGYLKNGLRRESLVCVNSNLAFQLVNLNTVNADFEFINGKFSRGKLYLNDVPSNDVLIFTSKNGTLKTNGLYVLGIRNHQYVVVYERGVEIMAPMDLLNYKKSGGKVVNAVVANNGTGYIIRSTSTRPFRTI